MIARGVLTIAIAMGGAGCARDLGVTSAAADDAHAHRDHRPAPRSPAPAPAPAPAPSRSPDEVALQPVAAAKLCVTRGELARADGMLEVRVPTMRAVASAGDGDAAALRFVYQGDTDEKALLASGQERHQLGLKLRAADSCNLVYVMWRISPKPGIEVQVKRNPDAHTHAECGTKGYIKLKAEHPVKLPTLAVGDTHTLRATITGDRLQAWIDDRVVWDGTLDPSVRDLRGPAGMRTDNVHALVELAVPPAGGTGRCPTGADGPD